MQIILVISLFRKLLLLVRVIFICAIKLFFVALYKIYKNE